MLSEKTKAHLIGSMLPDIPNKTRLAFKIYMHFGLVGVTFLMT